MEIQSIMDNNYGHLEVPDVLSPIEVREKYWGKIINVCRLENCSLKIIEMNANTQSSMEFHTEKDETYYILSGKIKLGLRVGRGVNRSVILNSGDVYHVPRGLMHMRIALEDSVIIEIASNDTDADSHIVEDGKTYNFKELMNE